MAKPRHRTFKDRNMQTIYDHLRANPPANLNAFKGRGGVSSAYVTGYLHPKLTGRYLTLSHAYAGWAAGVDNARAKAGEG